MGLKDSKDLAEEIVDRARRAGAAFCDVRFTEIKAAHILVQDGRADKVSAEEGRGFGTRVLADGAWGFACADGLEKRTLLAKVDEALHMARASKEHVRDAGVVSCTRTVEGRESTPVRRDPSSVSISEKMRPLVLLERAPRQKYASLVVNTVVIYGDFAARETIANSFGTFVEREVVRTSVAAMVTVAKGNMRQRNSQRKAMLSGFELVEGLTPEESSLLAAERAVTALDARKAPPGEMPVVFHPSITGLLVHEALGHSAEADSVWSGESILRGRLGETVASPLVTIIDDSTVPRAYGSYQFDSEGTPGGRRIIVANGVLETFLHSLETAARFGVEPTGSGRAEDCSAPPIVRMSNTYMARGKSSLEEMLRGIDRGIYLREGEWGYVFVEKGHFTCHASSAQMIEHGKLGEPLRDVTVSGPALETLKDIDMVGSDFELRLPGQCGKAGQGIPTDAGGPHVRVKRLTVGGEEKVDSRQ